jgi:hypothetical protein
VIYRAVNASISRTAQAKFSLERFTGSKLKRTYRLTCGDKDVYTGVDSCLGFNLYRSYHDGVCGTYSTLYQSNSATCGYVAPAPVSPAPEPVSPVGVSPVGVSPVGSTNCTSCNGIASSTSDNYVCEGGYLVTYRTYYWTAPYGNPAGCTTCPSQETHEVNRVCAAPIPCPGSC